MYALKAPTTTAFYSKKHLSVRQEIHLSRTLLANDDALDSVQPPLFAEVCDATGRGVLSCIDRFFVHGAFIVLGCPRRLESLSNLVSQKQSALLSDSLEDNEPGKERHGGNEEILARTEDRRQALGINRLEKRLPFARQQSREEQDFRSSQVVVMCCLALRTIVSGQGHVRGRSISFPVSFDEIVLPRGFEKFLGAKMSYSRGIWEVVRADTYS